MSFKVIGTDQPQKNTEKDLLKQDSNTNFKTLINLSKKKLII